MPLDKVHGLTASFSVLSPGGFRPSRRSAVMMTWRYPNAAKKKKLVLKQASHPSLTHNTSHHTQPLSTMPVDMCTAAARGRQKEEEEVLPYSSKQASHPSLPHTLSPHT